MVAAISHVQDQETPPQKGGPWGKVWSPEEIEIVTANYEKKSVRSLMKLLPKRSRSAILAMGGKLGLTAANARRRWDDQEDQTIESEWEFSTVAAIAKSLHRSQPSVIKRAATLGLHVGPPEGAESLVAATKRTGFTSLHMLKTVLAFSNVEIFPCKTYPKSWKDRHRRKAWKKNKKATPERKNCVRHYVWIEEVDEAAAHWVRNAEVVGPAAERRGINKVRLRNWLTAAGEPKPPGNCVWWVSTATIDRVVVANRALMVGRDTLTAIAERIGIGWGITKKWVTEAGLKSIPSPMDDFEYLFVIAEVEQVIAERSKNNAKVVIKGERTASLLQIERRRKSIAFEKLREARALQRARNDLLKALRRMVRDKAAAERAERNAKLKLLSTLVKIANRKVKMEKAQAKLIKHRNSPRYLARQLRMIMVAVGLPEKFIKQAKRHLSKLQHKRLRPVEKGVGSPVPKARTGKKRLV